MLPAGTKYLCSCPARSVFCHMDLFVRASGRGIISSDAHSILGMSQSAGNCAPSLLNTVHERPEWLMNLSISMRILECYKMSGLRFFPFLSMFAGREAEAVVWLKGGGDNWSWLFWCADNGVIRPNHIKGTLLSQQRPYSYSQDIGNCSWLWLDHGVRPKPFTGDD